jgi:hypothetical protein
MTDIQYTLLQESLLAGVAMFPSYALPYDTPCLERDPQRLIRRVEPQYHTCFVCFSFSSHCAHGSFGFRIIPISPDSFCLDQGA